MTQTSTSNPQNPSKLLQEKSSLIIQTSEGPSLDVTAAELLRSTLKQQYPELNIDPDRTLLVTPQWKQTREQFIGFDPKIESLTETLLSQSQSGQIANFTEGEHFLTPAPLTIPPIQLAVSIEEIADILNDYAPLLYVEFQQRQLDYWNESLVDKPRWHVLSDTLKKALNLEQVNGWTADQCAVARAVCAHPDKTERAKATTTIPGIQACLIDIDYNESDNTSHFLLGGAIVLKATHNQQDMLLLYSIEGGYEAFDSMDKLGASLPGRMNMENAGASLQWRLFEPDGDIFDYLAWALVAGQIESLSALTSSRSTSTNQIFSPASTGNAGRFSAEEKERIKQLKDAVPEWLSNASATDLQDYGHYLSNQGKLRNGSALNDIELITPYAQEQMRNAIVADRRVNHGNDAVGLPLDELQITITNSMTAGAFTLPNPQDIYVESLGKFGLQNVAPYKAELKFKNNQACPEWLTVAYLNKMAEQVDIGKTYPAQLKKKLIDDEDQALLQQQRYVSLLPDLLKLKALECKLQKEARIDDVGYQYVCELMDVAQGQPRKAPLDIVIRPLSFVPRYRLLSGGDTVANMFIIGPRTPHNGPCLLYRPALEDPLIQFASFQNMIYAMHQPGELRDSVLAWLPTPALSFEYSQYVFPVGLPSPWLVTASGIELLLNLGLSGPISLGTEEITDDILATLFTSNAQTLVEQADRQSLSNGERRWELLRDSGWAIFSVASTFLTGPVGTAAWVWQSIEQLQQGLEAHERGDSLVEWTSLGDVLMTLGMILIHQAGRRISADIERLRGEPKQWPSSVTTVRPLLEPVATTMTLDTTALSGELPAAHATVLEAGESVPRRTPTALGVYLDSVKVSAPNLTNKELITLNDKPPHLYQLNEKNYAKVANRWFQVLINDDEQVQIVNPKNPARSGPLLTHDQKGNWYVDTRLRLRGGGLRSRLSALRLEKEQRKATLHAKLKAFKSQENAIAVEVAQLRENMMNATGDNFKTQTALFTDKLEARVESYQQAIEQLNEWRALGGTTGYSYDLLRLTTQMEKHLTLWFAVKSQEYSTAILTLLSNDAINTGLPVGDNLQSIENTVALSQAISERLVLARSAMTGLNVLGRAARESIQTIQKILPTYSPLDYKANEIGMAYELCVQEQAGAQMPQARKAVADIVIGAAEASQELTDILLESTKGQTTQQRITAATRILDVFADALQRIDNLPTQYPNMTKPQALARLQALIKEFQEAGQAMLYDLLPEGEQPVAPDRSTSPVAGPSRPQAKVTKTRPREPAPSDEQKTDAPAFKKLIPKTETPGKPVRNDLDVISDGLELNLELEPFITRISKDAERANSIPADRQHEFDSQALKYEEEAAAVDTAIANIRAANGTLPPVATLSAELRSAAVRLRTTGISVRASMLKKRKPRLEYLQWLHENAQVKLTRNKEGRIKTKGKGDYFQEYKILDITRNDQPLWLAHFHYDTANSPAAEPTVAHLKIADTYLDTLDLELKGQLLDLEPRDYVVRRITDPATRSLFLALEPRNPASLSKPDAT